MCNEMVTRKPPAPQRSTAAPSPGTLPPDPFSAVADPTRRAILDGLRAAPRTAGDIASDFTISRPGVSRHLRILTGAGLVRVVKHGRQRRYHLEAAPLAEIDAWVARYRLYWAARLMDLKEHLEAEPDTPGPLAPSNPPSPRSHP